MFSGASCCTMGKFWPERLEKAWRICLARTSGRTQQRHHEVLCARSGWPYRPRPVRAHTGQIGPERRTIDRLTRVHHRSPDRRSWTERRTHHGHCRMSLSGPYGTPAIRRAEHGATTRPTGAAMVCPMHAIDCERIRGRRDGCAIASGSRQVPSRSCQTPIARSRVQEFVDAINCSNTARSEVG